MHTPYRYLGSFRKAGETRRRTPILLFDIAARLRTKGYRLTLAFRVHCENSLFSFNVILTGSTGLRWTSGALLSGFRCMALENYKFSCCLNEKHWLCCLMLCHIPTAFLRLRFPSVVYLANSDVDLFDAAP